MGKHSKPEESATRDSTTEGAESWSTAMPSESCAPRENRSATNNRGESDR